MIARWILTRGAVRERWKNAFEFLVFWVSSWTWASNKMSCPVLAKSLHQVLWVCSIKHWLIFISHVFSMKTFLFDKNILLLNCVILLKCFYSTDKMRPCLCYRIEPRVLTEKPRGFEAFWSSTLPSSSNPCFPGADLYSGPGWDNVKQSYKYCPNPWTTCDVPCLSYTGEEDDRTPRYFTW